MTTELSSLIQRYEERLTFVRESTTYHDVLYGVIQDLKELQFDR